MKYFKMLIALPWIIFGNWRWFTWQVGQARLLFGWCPCCNSSAPQMYNCPICQYYHGPWPVDKKIKKSWENWFYSYLYKPEEWHRNIWRELVTDSNASLHIVRYQT